MVYNGRFGVERIIEENPKPHLFEEPAPSAQGELSFLEYTLYLGLREDIQKRYKKPLGDKFPRENPTKEHYQRIQKISDKFL